MGCPGQVARARPVGGPGPRRYTAVAVEVGIGLGAQGPRGETAPAQPREGETDDAALVAALGRGEAQALERLYERHSRGVFSLALHLLGERAGAEEVLQETFLKLWRQPAAYEPQRGKLLTWLLGVAHHHAVDLLRRRRLEQRHQATPMAAGGESQVDALEVFGRAPDDANPEARAGHAEQRRLVVGALANLPEEQRVPLELAYYRGLTQAEIATLLGQPLGTVKTRMRLGLRRLRAAPGLADLWSER